MSLSYDPKLRQVATKRCRELRKSQTNAEKIFWEAVRNRKFTGLKFYRQYPIFYDYTGRETFYIADFFCFEKKLVIEIDGTMHDYRKKQDEMRTDIINLLGVEVIRFKNEEIEKNLERVLEKIKKKLV